MKKDEAPTAQTLEQYLGESRHRYSSANYTYRVIESNTNDNASILLSIWANDSRSDNKLEEITFTYNNQIELEADLSQAKEGLKLVMEESAEVLFRPKANILILLGEELIKDPVMAIYELVKNSYDADATEVNVSFKHAEDRINAVIEIEDNGTGITEEILTNVWFEPGTSFRKPVDSKGIRQIIKSPVFNRVPMGEKGVGRFAVHKLSNRIKLITRPSEIIKGQHFTHIKPLGYELYVEIDWRSFSQQQYLDSVSIIWRKRTDPTQFHFQDKAGTYIELKSLKEDWNRRMARQLKRHTIAMLAPGRLVNTFHIGLNFHNNWLDAIPSVEEILSAAPYQLTATIDKEYNLKFEYKFEVKNRLGLDSRKVVFNTKDDNDIKGKFRPAVRAYFTKEREVESSEVEDLIAQFLNEPVPFGGLKFELFSYDLDAISLRDTMPNYGIIKTLLKDHAGIKVFKGDLRVYDYGEPGNDWLGLDLKRVQNKEWFSNNQVIGFVHLDPEESGQLVEKTNREGFILNEAFKRLIISLDTILYEFKAERSIDRERWLNLNDKAAPATLEGDINGFKELVANANIPDEKIKDKLLLEAKRIEIRYEQDKNSLLIPAGVGMTASFAIHEIEKLVPRLQESVKETPLNAKKLQAQVAELTDYVNGILSILKQGEVRIISLKEIIDQAIKNHSLRLRLRKVSVNIDIASDATELRCDKRLLITMLMNLIDNSIYWLDTTGGQEKSIYIGTRRLGKSIHILVVDNGPGFKDKVEDIVRPFFSRKEGGIGIGMYLVDTAMAQFGRLHLIYDKEELLEHAVPDTYNGAAVELIFNNQ